MIRFATSREGIESVYRITLHLYPPRFRERYQDAVLQSLRDALADGELPRAELLRTLFVDLVTSVIKENLAMLRDTLARPILLYNALVLMALVTVLSLGFVVIEQSMLRESANDPQMGMSADIAMRLAHGETAQSAIATGGQNDRVDMDASLSPFAIVYDEQGHVAASSGELNGVVPTLPAGVLSEVLRRGGEKLTWAPRPTVRIAASIRHVTSGNGGFVLTGRNLREVEVRKNLILEQAALVWAGLMATIFVSVLIFGFASRDHKAVVA